ncbi:MAG TPA: HlyD family efflux transporter periplasmic adaptor subunit [Polyangia bacterium]
MTTANKLYRSEALSAHQAANRIGEPINLTPGWLGTAYWVIAWALVAFVTYGSIASVVEYAEGPALIRIDGRRDLVSVTGGSVMEVDVEPGQAVEPGQVLARLYSGAEEQELDRVVREFELRLVRLLVDANDQATRESLAALTAQREQMEARLREKSILAPAKGIVTNVRVRPGQSIAAGDVAMTLVDEGSGGFSVTALIPGQFRPLLRSGMRMSIALDGYPHVHSLLSVDTVSDEAVGPTEVRRYLGQEVADSVFLQGPLVMVRARLPQPTFLYDGRRYRYHDGMPATAEIGVRSVRVLVSLFPALRKVFGNQ